MTDSVGELFAPLRTVIADGRRRRRAMLAVSGALAIGIVVNLATIIGVGVLVVHDRQARHAELRRERTGQQVLNDVYRLLGDNNRMLRDLTGEPAQPPTVPPSLTTTRTTTTTRAPANRGTTTTQMRPTTTTPGSRSTQPPPSTSTTTTVPPPPHCQTPTIPVVGCPPSG